MTPTPKPHTITAVKVFLILMIIDLLMGLFRGAVFHHGGVPENCPLALMLDGPFSLLKIAWKTAN